jgi:hypothetical protein
MVDITENELREFATRTNRPIPGQSLTNSPDAPWPWETPPEFTTKEQAMDYFFKYVTDEGRFEEIMGALAEGMAVMDMVQMLVVKAFQDGKINPDMVMMLAEPLAFLLIGLAEREGIRTIIVDDPEDPDNEKNKAEMLNPDMPVSSGDILRNNFQTITDPQDNEELNLQERINEAPSLMERRA